MNGQAAVLMAGVTRLELATFPSRLTGRSNQSFNIFFAFSRFDLVFTNSYTGSIGIIFTKY